MLFKPHAILQEMPSELQEAVNINSWKDMIYMAYKVATYCSHIFCGEISKERIKIDTDPFPLEKGSAFVYQVILDGFGLIGFVDEANINEAGIKSI